MPSIEISFNQIAFDPLVQTFCNNSKFKCPNYNHSWACPPVAPYLEKEISKYKRFFLVYKKFNLDEYIIKEKERHPKRKKKRILNSFYRKNILRDHLEQEVYTFLKEFKDTYKESIILWDGHCRLCFKENKRCTYDEGEPCRYTPRYSMEAVGINVDQTIKNLNNDEIKMEWPPEHSAYRFGLVCFK